MTALRAFYLLIATSLCGSAAGYPLDKQWANTAKIPSSFKPVTSVSQLWRFQVGEGADGITAGSKYICLRSVDGRYLKTWHNRGIGNTNKACGTDERWWPILMNGNSWRIKAAYDERSLNCYDGAAIGYKTKPFHPFDPAPGSGRSDSDVMFLFINENEDEVIMQGAPHGGLVTTRWNTGHVDCQDSWNSRVKFYGWKTGPKSEWKPKDSKDVVVDCDNSGTRRNDAVMICSYERVVGEQKAESRSSTVSTSVSVSISKGFAHSFSAEISSTVGYDWTKTSSETYSTARKSTVQMTVPPGKHFRVLQVVGTYGPFEFRTPKFIREEVVHREGAVADIVLEYLDEET